jgi:hypothetical protein
VHVADLRALVINDGDLVRLLEYLHARKNKNVRHGMGPTLIAWSRITHSTYTRALHVVERYRLLDFEAAKEGLERDAKENLITAGLLGVVPNYRGKHLQLHFTVDDEGVFTMPWSATITYRPALYEWGEYICAENIRGYSAGKGPPRAEKPDF